jgi:cyclophilin family peptidyl-prolyl cis-trans isomerase
MTCNSTKGAFAVALDPSLCPRSVRQVAAMVQARFFTQGLSFWRVNEWITQFGADESPTARQVRILLSLNFHYSVCLAIAACVC